MCQKRSKISPSNSSDWPGLPILCVRALAFFSLVVIFVSLILVNR